MSGVETLTDLYNAYRQANGAHGRPLSHRAAAARAGDPGKYETFRLIGTGKHGGAIDEDTVRALVRLGLNEVAVRRAAGHQISRVEGPFQLPSRADRLTRQQREVVLSVVDVILAAAERPPLSVVKPTDPVQAEVTADMKARIEGRKRRTNSNPARTTTAKRPR